MLTEVAGLADQGVKEVTLLGQNVNGYRGRMGGGNEIADFAHLLAYVHEIPGLERIRYTTSHPNEFTQRLIDAYAHLPKLVNHVHLPVQHGSDRMLAAMKRSYTAMEYKHTVRQLAGGATGHQPVERLHRRLPRRDRRRPRQDDEADRRPGFRQQLLVRVLAAARYAGGGAGRRHASGRQARATARTAGAGGSERA